MPRCCRVYVSTYTCPYYIASLMSYTCPPRERERERERERGPINEREAQSALTPLSSALRQCSNKVGLDCTVMRGATRFLHLKNSAFGKDYRIKGCCDVVMTLVSINIWENTEELQRERIYLFHCSLYILCPHTDIRGASATMGDTPAQISSLTFSG